MTTTINSVAAAERMRSAVAALADEITDGIPVCDNVTHEPLMFAGKRVMRAGIPVLGMDCRAVDALAEMLLLHGHPHAARTVIAEHTSDDDSEEHTHLIDEEADRVARLKFADQYLTDTFGAPTSTREPVRANHFTLDVVAANGTPFRVIAYAPNAAGPIRAYDPTKARVEFYDRRYPHTSQGQFTGGSYLLETLLEGSGWGLCLAGGVAAWSIDEATMRLVEQWLTGIASALAL